MLFLKYSKRPSTLSPVEVKSKVVSVEVYGYPGEGQFEVHVYYRGIEVTATVTIVDPNTGQEIATYIAPSDFPVWLDTGNYLAYAYYNNYEASQIVEIKEGQTTIWRVYMQPRRICFIATVCYGYNHPNLETFRTFRDNFLMKNVFGRKLVYLYYYIIGEPVAKFLVSHRAIRKTVKTILNVVNKIIRRVSNEKATHD